MKRVFDLVLASVLILTGAPLLLFVSAAIKLDSQGGILFRQERVGRYGKTFRIFKFRSMVSNAAQTGPWATTDNDPRITRLGRLIRRSSIDELPQLINVLLGDMSLVGPRPDVPAQREEYTAQEWAIRHQVRPGITGLAQATLRSSATRDQRKIMDIYYAENVSLCLDFRILFMTIKQVLFKGGN